MRLLFLGDLVGRAGRTAVIEALPKLRADWKLDFVAVNAENAASGFGLTAAIAEQLFAAGTDCLTLGDHAFDQKEMITHIEGDSRILRPLNYGKGAPGRGARLFEVSRGRKVYLAVALGRIFMNRPFDDPFSALDAALKTAPLDGSADAVIVEIHAEATSEKMAIGHWCDGRASLVVGSHTHVPTADALRLPKGSAYHTDAGMCGDYDSVIGMEKSEPLRRFVTGMGNGRFEPALGAPTICGTYVETDDVSGFARRIAPVRIRGKLEQTPLPI